MSTSQLNTVSAPLDPQKNSNLEFDIASLAAKYELTQQELNVLSQQQAITQAMTASEPPESKSIDYAVMSREGELAALMLAGGGQGDPFLPSPPNTSFFAPPSFTIYQEFGTHEFKCVNPLVIVDGKEVEVDTDAFNGSDGTWVCEVLKRGGASSSARLVKEGTSGEKEDLVATVKIAEISPTEIKQFHTGVIIYGMPPVDDASIDFRGGDDKKSLELFHFSDGEMDLQDSLVQQIQVDPDTGDVSSSNTDILLVAKQEGHIVYLPIGKVKEDDEDDEREDPCVDSEGGDSVEAGESSSGHASGGGIPAPTDPPAGVPGC